MFGQNGLWVSTCTWVGHTARNLWVLFGVQPYDIIFTESNKITGASQYSGHEMHKGLLHSTPLQCACEALCFEPARSFAAGGPCSRSDVDPPPSLASDPTLGEVQVYLSVRKLDCEAISYIFAACRPNQARWDTVKRYPAQTASLTREYSWINDWNQRYGQCLFQRGSWESQARLRRDVCVLPNPKYRCDIIAKVVE